MHSNETNAFQRNKKRKKLLFGEDTYLNDGEE